MTFKIITLNQRNLKQKNMCSMIHLYRKGKTIGTESSSVVARGRMKGLAEKGRELPEMIEMFYIITVV